MDRASKPVAIRVMALGWASTRSSLMARLKVTNLCGEYESGEEIDSVQSISEGGNGEVTRDGWLPSQ